MTIAVGEVLPEFRVASVDTEKMKTMAALLRDPNPIHFDLDVVRALGLGERPVNQGPIHFAYLMNMVAAWAGGFDRLRTIDVRFQGNVFGGDEVAAAGRVVEVGSTPDATTARCEVWVDVVGGERALSGEVVVQILKTTEASRKD
jgi:acyl dehydratase